MAALRMVDGLWSRCMTLVDSGQLAAAKLMIQRLLQLEIPASMRSEASMMLADMLRMQGEFQLARRHVCAAIAGDPEDAALHHMLGYLHDEDEDGSELSALKHLKHAVKLAPDSAECHRALGEYLVQHGQPKKGMNHIEEARTLEPDNLDVLRTYVVTQVELGKEHAARQCLREVQFRLGKAHTSVQTLWNDLAYAIALKQQQVRNPVATLPMLKPVSESSKSAACMPRILRFDAAHPMHSRKNRLAPRPKK